MAKCNLSISLDKKKYSTGETLRGVLHVEVDEPCQCNALTIKKYWETLGKGDTDYGLAQELNLFRGEWQPGQYEYPFEFVLEHSPVSYKGHHFSLDWYLLGNADIPWAFDPKTKYSYLLQAGKPSDEYSDEYIDERKKATLQDLKRDIHAPKGLKELIPMCVVLLILASVFFILAKQEYEIGGSFLAVGLGLFYYHIKARISEYKTGEIKCSLSETVLNPGDTLRCQVSFTPRTHLKINAITLTLSGREISESGSGKKRRAYTHQIYKEQFSLLESRQIEADMPLNSKLDILIPEDAACTFYASSNQITWEAKIKVDINNWQDWAKVETITIIS